MQLLSRRYIACIVGLFGFSFVLTYCYQQTAISLSIELWSAAAVIHAAFAVIWMRVPWLRTLPTISDRWTKVGIWLSVAVGLGSVFLVIGSRMSQGLTAISQIPELRVSWFVIGMITWVPWCEEIFFRGCVGGFLEKHLGGLYSLILSAIFFGWMHSLPTIPALIAGHLSIPFGAFLLGLICHVIYFKSGRLWVSALFHAACNLTGIIFYYGDARWLKWLDALYL